MKWTLAEASAAVGGQLSGAHTASVIFNSVTTDSRAMTAGQLFVALRGERFDGHDFLGDAQQAGVAAALISRREAVPPGLPVIEVSDTRLALGSLAAAWRRRFSIPVIGITGSNGKTTTKEMVAAILRAAFGPAVLATQGNLNNDIGLPLTLLRMTPEDRAAVIEMGMNHPGEIDYLAALASPTAAVVTNAQRAHLEGMGDLAEIAREKGSLYRHLSPHGVAAIVQGQAFTPLWTAQAAGHAMLTFGETPDCTVQAQITEKGFETLLSLKTPQGHCDIPLKIPGLHNARNALAAAAVCLAAEVPLAAIQSGLSLFAGVPGRLEKSLLPKGISLLDDSYNANPDSVRAGIDVLAQAPGAKILVLGDMGEIGSEGMALHREVGAYAQAAGVNRLLTLGNAAREASAAFGSGGTHFESLEQLLPVLQASLLPRSTVLVKGSRFMRMEKVCQALRESLTVVRG